MSKIITTTIQKYYDTKLKAWVTAKDNAILEVVAANKLAAENADKALGERIDTAEGNIGDLETLSTTAKEDLVKAINEVRASVSAGSTAAAITIDASTTTEGALKSYTIKQGENTVGVIDIPKDMVVESGTVVQNPEGQTEGTYIKLVLANVAEPLFINVGTLVDIYTAKANATQIQLAIDSSTREISATIVAGSVGTAELAAGAVTTEKIADGNITLAKLSTKVQESLGKADSAVQSIAEGGTNGTLNIDGVEVPVHGLGSAAFTGSDAYDAAGSAKAVEDKLEEYKKSNDEALKGAQDGVADLEPRVAANEAAVADHETRIAALEGIEYATTADIDAMFEEE